LNATYYASAELQLDTVMRLCAEVPASFLAKTAVYARERGFMKDLPALLCAVLSVEDAALCEQIFDRVIDDGKMLRNFVQIVRSGVVGRKSLGSLPKRLVQRWFAQRTDAQVFRASVGQDPSLVYVADAGDAPSAPATGEDTPAARITLRLPEGLKVSIELAASREGVSVNTWLVRALARAVGSGGPRRGPGNRLTGFGRS
jgi:hypothetical protein